MVNNSTEPEERRGWDIKNENDKLREPMYQEGKDDENYFNDQIFSKESSQRIELKKESSEYPNFFIETHTKIFGTSEKKPSGISTTTSKWFAFAQKEENGVYGDVLILSTTAHINQVIEKGENEGWLHQLKNHPVKRTRDRQWASLIPKGRLLQPLLEQMTSTQWESLYHDVKEVILEREQKLREEQEQKKAEGQKRINELMKQKK